jgi:lipopolysaccharide export system protein LptA
MNRPKALTRLMTLVAPLALLGAGVVHAQLASSSKAPVDITADQLEVQNAQCLTVWRGSAEALQETSRLRANTMNIYNKVLGGKGASGQQNCGQLDHMEADGDVYYVTPNRVVKGDHAVYTAANKTIVMTGRDVVATQCQNVISGTRLEINTETGQATMVSEPSVKSGRVRAVLYPNQSTDKTASDTCPGAATAPVKAPPPRKHG